MNYLGILQPLLDTMKWLILAMLLIGLQKKPASRAGSASGWRGFCPLPAGSPKRGKNSGTARRLPSAELMQII
ncbi:hypothetical protein D3C85_1527950 [compost metagenome]